MKQKDRTEVDRETIRAKWREDTRRRRERGENLYTRNGNGPGRQPKLYSDKLIGSHVKGTLNYLLKNLRSESAKRARRHKSEALGGCTTTYRDIFGLYLDQRQLCAHCHCFLFERDISIDRVDNAVGYTKDNILVSCVSCNLWRGDMTLSEFYEKARRMAKEHP